jgi:hypothetical protein
VATDVDLERIVERFAATIGDVQRHVEGALA